MKVNRRERTANRKARESISGKLGTELDAIFDRFRIQGLNRTRLGQSIQGGAGVGAINNPVNGFRTLSAQLDVAVSRSIDEALDAGIRLGEGFANIAPSVDRAVINEAAASYINRPNVQQGLRAITNMDGVRSALTDVVRGETNIVRVVDQIAENIGLTPAQSKQVRNLRRKLQQTRLTTPLGDTPLLRAGIDADVENLARRLRRNRARAIADNETQRAIQAGERIWWNCAISEGEVDGDRVVKRWFTLRDDDVCPICEPLDGQVIPLTDSFDGQWSEPPAHFSCRCFIEYRELGPDGQAL